MFFDGEALSMLQYPPVSEQVTKRCRFLLQFSKRIASQPTQAAAVFDGICVDANTLGWALASVSSRAFKVGDGAGKDSRAMLPLIDMANHSRCGSQMFQCFAFALRSHQRRRHSCLAMDMQSVACKRRGANVWVGCYQR